MQVKVTQVTRKDTNKEGVAYEGKYGHYWLINIKDDQENWYSTFCSKEYDPVNKIEVGGTYSIGVTETLKGDKVFKNFKLLSPEEKEVEDMKVELAALKAAKATPSTPQQIQEEEVNLDSF